MTSSSPNVNLTAPPPAAVPGAPDFGFEPTLPPGQEGAREQEFYPTDPVTTIHAPAYLKGATTMVRTGARSGMRIGLSGWTAPRVPFDDRESSGGAALGLSIDWGRPMPEAPAPAPTESGSQR